MRMSLHTSGLAILSRQEAMPIIGSRKVLQRITIGFLSGNTLGKINLTGPAGVRRIILSMNQRKIIILLPTAKQELCGIIQKALLSSTCSSMFWVEGKHTTNA